MLSSIVIILEALLIFSLYFVELIYVPINESIAVFETSCVEAFITSPSLYIVIPSIGNKSISNKPFAILLAFKEGIRVSDIIPVKEELSIVILFI